MSAFLVSTRKEWLDHWRNYRLLILTVVLVLFGLLSPFTARYGPEMMRLLPNGEAIAKLIPPPTVADAVAQYVKNISQFGVILALLLTMGAVAQEKDKGTAAMMLVKPLPRRSFLLAKFAVLGASFSAAIGLAGLAAWYYTWLLFGPIALLPWLTLNGLIVVYILVHLAVTLLFSVAARSQVAAGGSALGVLLLLAIVGSIPVVGAWLPSRLLGWGSTLVIGTPLPAWPALGVSVGMVVAALGAAIAVFERQEL